MYLLSSNFLTIASFVDWLDNSTAELCICFSTLHIVGSFYLNFLRPSKSLIFHCYTPFFWSVSHSKKYCFSWLPAIPITGLGSMYGIFTYTFGWSLWFSCRYINRSQGSLWVRKWSRGLRILKQGQLGTFCGSSPLKKTAALMVDLFFPQGVGLCTATMKHLPLLLMVQKPSETSGGW